MAAAQGEFGVLLNNDALLFPNQLSQLLDAYSRHHLRGIYTARIVDEQGREEASCFRAISPDKLLISAFLPLDRATRSSAYTLAHLQDEALEVDWCTGAFMLFPRKVWEECGGFDENFFMYYEDVDLCLRWRARGYGCHVNTLIDVQHACGGSSTNPVERARIVDKSQRYFYAKNYGAAGAIKSRAFQILRSALRCTAHGLLSFAPKQRSDCILHFNLLKAAITNR
jgi:GT2 family glycosyltransferase